MSPVLFSLVSVYLCVPITSVRRCYSHSNNGNKPEIYFWYFRFGGAAAAAKHQGETFSIKM